MDFVVDATKRIAPYVRPGNYVILESTSPVGSTEMIRDVLREEGVEVERLHFAYCPERVLPGRIMIELVDNDRIVGGLTTEATEKVAAFYATFVNGKVLTTDSKTAEMTKLVENASRDVQIAFANELSMICDKLGIDVWELIALANHHPRVNILKPGAGVGGHCIAVDPWFIVAKTPERALLIKQAREVNNYKTDWVIEKIRSAMADRPGAKVAFMGIAFKPDIDDLRESPALRVVEAFKASGANMVVCEPNVAEYQDYALATPEEAVKKADIVVFLVAHRQFPALDCAGKVVLDFCGIGK